MGVTLPALRSSHPPKHCSRNSCPIVVDRSAIKSLDRGVIHDTTFSNDANCHTLPPPYRWERLVPDRLAILESRSVSSLSADVRHEANGESRPQRLLAVFPMRRGCFANSTHMLILSCAQSCGSQFLQAGRLNRSVSEGNTLSHFVERCTNRRVGLLNHGGRKFSAADLARIQGALK